MSDIHGPITHATIASGLWAIVLAPLLAAAWFAYAHLAPLLATKKGQANKAPDALAVANGATLAAAFSFGWSAFQTLKLSELAEGERLLLEPVLRLARFGQLDFALDLAFDSLTSIVVLVASGVALLVFVVARGQLPRAGGAPRFFGWGSLLLGGTLLALLADGLIGVLLGWGFVGVASWGLVAAADERRARRSLAIACAANASLLLGTAVLFWGLGGAWMDQEYTPDLTPRFAAVRVGAAPDEDEKKGEADGRKENPAPGGKGFVTMNAYPGALVFMDDSRSPLMNGDVPLRSPFTRFEIAGGLHSFRIHPGSGLDDYLVSHVSVGKGKEVAFVVYGATTSFSQLRDQFVSELPAAQTPVRAALAAKKGGLGATVVTLAALLFFLAASAYAGLVPFARGAVHAAGGDPLVGALLASVATIGGPYLLARVAGVIALSGPASALIATLGGASAVLCAWRASRTTDLRRVVAHVGASQLALAIIAAAVGAPAAAALALAAYAPAAAALWVCVAYVAPRSTDVRVLGGLRARMPQVARAFAGVASASCALVPGLSGFWAAHAVLSSAVAARTMLTVPGWFVAALGTVAVALLSFALWRAYFVVFEGPLADEKKAPKSTEPSGALLVLALVGATIGAVLGAGGRLFSGRGTTLLGEWLEPLTFAVAAPFAPLGTAVPWGLSAVIVGAALAGFLAARAKYGPRHRKADWAKREPSSEGPASSPSEATPAFASVAAGLDRWALGGVYGLVGSTARAAASLAGALEEKIVGAGVDAVGERAARLDARSRALGAAACVAVVAALLYFALGRHP